MARVAGIMAAKRTPELIALCHPLPIERVGIEVTIDAEAGEVRITGEVETIARTGVEMEALTAVSVAALNVYDMVKGIDKGVVVEAIRLLEKTKGGPVTGPALRVVVITVSDRSAARGARGPLGARAGRGRRGLGAPRWWAGTWCPTTRHGLTTLLQTLCDAPSSPDLILTTGGTGVGPRDCTPEATRAACERMVPGIAETLRARSLAVTPHAMLSRGEAGVRGTTLIVNLPGSPGGARDGWEVVAPVVAHAASQLRGGDHPAGPPAAVGAPPPAE